MDVTVRSDHLARTRSAETLEALLAGGEELTGVFHNNSEPDCLASSLALGTIAEHAGVDERRILYSGSISHQQNRGFVNLLDVRLQPFAAQADRNRPDGSLLAFVDHAVPGENNEVPLDIAVDVVIDHHDTEPVTAGFVDHRPGAGATVAFGLVGDSVHLGARSTDSRVHVGRVLEEAFADIGSADDHREMAGGGVPLGVFAGYADDYLFEVLDEVVTTRLEAAIDIGGES